jgi:hypothetical protein
MDYYTYGLICTQKWIQIAEDLLRNVCSLFHYISSRLIQNLDFVEGSSGETGEKIAGGDLIKGSSSGTGEKRTAGGKGRGEKGKRNRKSD